MIEIISAERDRIKDIQSVSAVAWPHAFKDILSASQIVYMMNWMYSDEGLSDQIEKKKHRYFIAQSDGENVGYLSIEHNCEQTGKTKIHKLYILPERQKKGIGKLLIEKAAQEAKRMQDMAIYLNVNKYNENAIAFYKRLGFFLAKEEIIDIGNGFVMDDFVFELQLTSNE